MTHGSTVRESPRRIFFHEFELDLVSGDLLHEGRPVRLAAQPASVLVLLAERAGELVTRTEIQQHVWGDQVIEQEQGLNTCIRQIRAALGDRPHPPRFIETVPRRGYRFIAPCSSGAPLPKPTPEVVASSFDSRQPAEPGSAWGRGRWLVMAAAVAAVAAFVVFFSGRPGNPAPAFPAAETGAGLKPSTVSPAREAYLKARYLLDSSSPRDPVGAQRELRRAIELDPGFALAHVALAEAHHAERRPSSLERQRRALTTALELDPNLAAAHLRLAKIQLHADWDFTAAGRSLERAVALEPEDTAARREYALYLSYLRRHDEAIAQIELARKLDPVSTVLRGEAVIIYFSARRYERTVEVAESALELDPNHLETRLYLLHAHRRLGRPSQARGEAVEWMRRAGASADQVEEVAGDDEVDRALRRFFEWQFEWQRQSYAAPVAMAAAALPLGREDEVFGWLEKAYEQRSGSLVTIAGDPRADAFREDPRFVELLRRVGFPADTIER